MCLTLEVKPPVPGVYVALYVIVKLSLTHFQHPHQIHCGQKHLKKHSRYISQTLECVILIY